MNRCLKMLTCLVLVLAMCFALSSLAFATDNESQAGSAVNGGLKAEILTEAEVNGAVPVTVKITNTNTFDVSGIGYKLTAAENGKLSGKTSDSNLTIAAGSSITSAATLKSASIGLSPAMGDTLNLTFWIFICVLSLAVLAYIAIKKKKVRQTIAMLLAVVMMIGIFASSGIPAVTASAASEAESDLSFTVSKDIAVDGKSVRLSLAVTLPQTADDINHTIKFMDADNQLVKSFTVPDGEVIDISEVPVLTRKDMMFNGWAVDADGTESFYLDTPVEKDMTVYPIYSELKKDEYFSPVQFDAEIVEQAHSVVIVSENEITATNLSDYATLETRFGVAPEITVTALGNNKYELSGVYPQKGTFCWLLNDDSVTFDGLDPGTREYKFSIIGEETQEYEKSDELRDISDYDFIALEATEDELVSILNVYGSAYAVGDKLGVIDEEGDRVYYKVTEIISSTTNPSSGKTNWSLKVTPCDVGEIYDTIDVNDYNGEADEIIDISDPEDIQQYLNQIKSSEEIRIYADYLASAINDSERFKELTTESYGTPAYIGYQSDTLLKAAGNSSADNASNAINETLELVGGISVNRPGVNISIDASWPTIKTNDFNKYWDERYSETGEIDPKTNKRVNVGKTDFFGKDFASIETAISITFSLNGGNKNIEIEAKLNFKQYVKICSATKVKVEVGWSIYKNSEIDAGATLYTETSVDFTVVLRTDNGSFDMTNEINDIVSAAKGEKYESDNKYIRRFRSIYDGSEDDFVEIYRKDFCQFVFNIGPVEINIPVAFIIRLGLSAGVGIGYDYGTNYTIGVYKEKNSNKITPHHSSAPAGWEFNFYVAGHVGVKLALNAQLFITITGMKKAFKIGLEAELGFRADFYGYFLLRHTKEWDSFDEATDTDGAYYFNTKVYFNFSLFAQAFVYEEKWSLYEWEESIFTSGNRYVLMDFNRRHEEQTEPVIIPVTKDSKMTTVQDGKFVFDTVTFSLDSYFKSLKPVFFDLQKSNEVFNEQEAMDLINKYTTVIAGHCLTLAGGKKEVVGSSTVHLRPDILNALLNDEKYQMDTYITFVYNGPVFALGDDRPSVTINVRLVNERYLTGERYNVNYWVEDQLYKSEQYIERTSIPPWNKNIDSDFYEPLGIRYAKFNIPTESVTSDMDLYAEVEYVPNTTAIFRSKTITPTGIDDSEYFKSYTLSKNSEVSTIAHSPGVLQPYFIGWDLEGDNSDELNRPIPEKNSRFVYDAVYKELPDNTVTVLDGATGNVLSTDDVKLGEVYTIGAPTPPADGRQYISTVTCERGDYASASDKLEAQTTICPTSDVTLVWNHEVMKYDIRIYRDNFGTLLENQTIEYGDFFTDPVGRDSWDQLDYQDDSNGYHEFIGWEVWDGTKFVDALTFPITDNKNIYPVFKYLGIRHNITLLDEDGETVLYSGLINNGRPLNEGYYRTRIPDKENNYELCWKSAEDGAIVENATKSGTYILSWAESEREYSIVLDNEAEGIANGAVVFEDKIPFSELDSAISEAIGTFVPVKQETDYVTYVYDGFYKYCDANVNGDYGICTVSFDFASVAKKCEVIYNVKDSQGNEGTLWFGQNQKTLQDGAYSFEFTISETDNTISLDHVVSPKDRNYNFVGWSIGDTVYDVDDTVSLVGLDTVTITAIYERKPFAVTFDADGGVYDGDLTVYANDDEIIEIPAISKESDAQYTYDFVGWYDSTEYHTDYYTVNGSVTLKAIFNETLRSYEITFIANGGGFADGSDSVSVVTDYGEIPACDAPTMDDTETDRYTFDGWTPAVVAVTGAATYTARWSSTELYTLTFDAGNGSFGTDGSVKTYVLESGDIFDIGTVPTPYYNYQGEVKKFNGWLPTVDSFTATENAQFTAVWSEPVTAIGVQISDGTNTEDIAAYLAGAQKVSGYSFEYNPGNEEYAPYFSLNITEDGLTLSGDGTVENVDIYNVSVKLDELTLVSGITAYGDCTVTVDGTVSLTAESSYSSVFDLIESEQYTECSLSFVGADSDASLTVNSSDGTGGINSNDGDITISNLTVDITTAEYHYPDSDEIIVRIALGALEASNNININDSTLRIHKGYLSGMINLTNSTVEFDDNDYNGLISQLFDYAEEPVIPDGMVTLINSKLIFNGKAYIDLAYSIYNSDPYMFYEFRKRLGEDEYGNPIVGWFMTSQELDDALINDEDAWLLNKDADSSIQVTE